MINFSKIVKIIIFKIYLMVFLFFNCFSQPPSTPFHSGEKLYYDISYNWHFVWVNAGKVEFQVDSTMYGDIPAYHFQSSGRSLSSYDWIFKVRDEFESVANAQTFQPYWFVRKTREGSYSVDNKLNFDWENHRIISKLETSKHPYRKDTIPLDPLYLDLQTAVYFARTLDFSKMEINQKIPFYVLIDGEKFELFGRYLGKETIKNRDGKYYRCHKFSALLVEGTMFKGGEDLYVWVTDDGNKIPILTEAKILVGSVKAYFTHGENLMYPMEALIQE